MTASLPNPDYATETDFRWPWFKFRLPPDALFTSLHDRFNTRPTAIQDPSAFHRDVVSCADESATIDEFYDNLSARRDERIREISAAWVETSCLLGGTPALWSHGRTAGNEHHDDDAGNDCPANRWRAFVQFCRTMSFDRMVMFFDEYASDERKRQQTEREEARKTLERLCALPACTSTEVSGGDPKHSDPSHDSTSDRKPSTATEADQAVVDAANLHPRPNVGPADLPSPRSESSSPVNTRKTKKRGRSNPHAGHGDEDELTGSSARRPKRRRGVVGAVDEEQSGSLKGSGSKDFFPVSPESSHDETNPSRNVIHNAASFVRPQSVSDALAWDSEKPTVQADGPLLSPASASTSHVNTEFSKSSPPHIQPSPTIHRSSMRPRPG